MTVRIGFVGVGKRSLAELRDLIRIPEAEIAAFCDLAPERCAQAIEQVNRMVAAGSHDRAPISPRCFTTVRAMLDGVGVDAVYVSLPPFAHGEVEHAIIDAGKAIFVEKPVARTMAMAREIAAHVAEKGVVSCVGYQWRYSSAVRKAHAVLRGVPIGLVMANRFGRFGQEGSPVWARRHAQSGGMLLEQHTHGVNICRYLAGEVASVCAFANTVLTTDVPEYDVADVNAVSLRFVSGAVGSIANSGGLAAGQGAPPGAGVHVIARGLTVSFSKDVVVLRAGGERETYPGDDESNFTMNRAFVDAVTTGDRSLIEQDYADGMRTFEVTYAATLSAERGGEVIHLALGDGPGTGAGR